MVTKFTKGGILNTTQLQNLSGKKWKKGGILSATQLNELSGSSEGNKKELVVTILEYDKDYNPTSISVSSNFKDVMREENINNISIKLVAGSDEGMCHVLSKNYYYEYGETEIEFVTPGGWSFYYFRITADGGQTLDVVNNIFANVTRLENSSSSTTVTVES